ncbi:Cd(II)/Pb(II)-responsive transcriptional regulator [Commensalibacter oyaizuii]|uniref:Cd(II)/Pb(II)-responsive transcriptional regulator n=1 Tax=Commensalibacter oyaizuii TaxID=3043873 RepID=A0ABT6Q0X4_9PROT|nr:Cd(II)/Pb(II)-responsive transcriptional regulator [Commensalibacter sp. TBRC 16381]MDI2090750.1 Cd(II)/Pb(II)-responsive transcriptional regulator [Commensalibacter sp. TBRC 16381]
MKEKQIMKIGEIAKKAGCQVETIRYYEKEGLLQKPLRDHVNNYRYYDQSHLERLIFIRRCRALNMTLEEIHALLQAREEGHKNCGQIDGIIRDHLIHVQQRIKELLALEKQLRQLNKNCNADRSVDNCGILHTLEQPLTEDIENALSTKDLNKVHSH